MASSYRKKPVIIEAEQWDGSEASARSIKAWAESHGARPLGGWAQDTMLLVRTLEGQMQAAPGDWIIRGVAGEFYPCKPDIFDATYEEATDAR